jgi:hypothetical protein
MAGRDRMTIEEVVRRVLRDEHGDVIRESVRTVAQELMEARARQAGSRDQPRAREDRQDRRTTSPTWGARILAIANALPVASITTRSSGARLCPNSSNCSGVVAIRPADRARPPSAIATWQKSRCTSSPIDLPTSTTSDLNDRPRGRRRTRTTPTDSRSQRTRASRRGGQLHQRAPSP